jgi:subtilisin family serine protease
MAFPLDESAGLEGVEIEVPDLTEAERADAARDPQVTALAAAMPLSPVEPVESEAVKPSAGATWGLDAVGATASPPFDGSGVTVAVLDTGIDLTRPAFAGIADRVTRRNFTTAADEDTHGHGTHCAGTIVGQDVGAQRIGVARGSGGP